MYELIQDLPYEIVCWNGFFIKLGQIMFISIKNVADIGDRKDCELFKFRTVRLGIAILTKTRDSHNLLSFSYHDLEGCLTSFFIFQLP